ncbi:hypothetical protein QBC42DRAFT_33987 [Cladorrhinum samala]|uniref:Uncharacterized protein n=1 Tax=Cladorrhinum samala TaxID=585594 RepID=A0AAV9HAT0_9PEZI|nr:hypothetical protein QBC42DRAFT_33987 [Cladorrhinum samala]
MMHSTLNHNTHNMAAHLPQTGYSVDNMLTELSRQLVANTKRHSNSHQQWHCNSNAMRISKPGSANNSPRSAMKHSRRRTLIGEGFNGLYQQQQPQQQQQQQAVDATYLPTPASEMHCEPVYKRDTRAARPVSWHPSHNSQAYHQQPVASYPSCTEAEILASFQQLPPTPAVYSGYTSPTESFSPLSLPYSGFSSQPVYSPQEPQLPLPQPQQAQLFGSAPSANYNTPSSVSDIPYQPATRVADSLAWDLYSTSSAMLNQHTAPPTPEDLPCSLPLSLDQTPVKAEPVAEVQVQVQEELNEDEDEGEILYGLGLYDPPTSPKADSMDLHRSTIFSLLGGAEPPVPKGLGLKLEEAWEPPVSEDDDEEEDGENDEDDE